MYSTLNNPYIKHTGLVPENLSDANNLVQLGEIQGLIVSIENILATKLSSVSQMTQRYARELINKLKVIYQYRWQSGDDSSNKMLVPSKNRGLYITESPHNILTKAREFVGMYTDLNNELSNWDKMSNSEKELLQRRYGKVYNLPLPEGEIVGEITGGVNIKKLSKKQFESYKKIGEELIKIYEDVKERINKKYEELKKTQSDRKLDRIKQKIDKKIKVLEKHKKKIIVATFGTITFTLLVSTIGIFATILLSLIGLGTAMGLGLRLNKEKVIELIRYIESSGKIKPSSYWIESSDISENESENESKNESENKSISPPNLPERDYSESESKSQEGGKSLYEQHHGGQVPRMPLNGGYKMEDLSNLW